MTILNLSPQELGERLRIARESSRITQATAAKEVGFARTTLVAIEKGARRIRINELQVLANLYGTSVNAILRREAVHVDLIPRFRRISETNDPDIDNAVRQLNLLVSADIELENILGIKHPTNYPQEKVIQSGDVYAQAEEHANQFRDFLGIGHGPISNIFSLIEIGLGIRLYQRRLPSKISGLFAYESKVGAAILLNANHTLGRRVQSAAHELGHFIGTRQSPEVLEKDEKFQSREERYAHAFGRILLTPRNEVTRKFKEITAGATHLTRRHIILLAHYFGVSRMAMVLRLEELALVKKGTWTWFKDNGGITNEQALSVLNELADRSDPAKEDADQPVPMRIGYMAYHAWKKDLLTEGQLASMLGLKRLKLRMLIDEIEELNDSEDNEVLLLPH
ncbi:transcriptional regulator [Hahella sp. CCB-MM4]|uniref:XRE family transcriptional regulator n=1 Tax=Hahella sp. (strain CCB-MM4) TaxID=1926491 RepID=UPI000B9AF377|nr:XRE family transcriptional regulator [Hahella sp. CCB-MM4]OZG73088.1 transcriptional regulator [Hahella sp. CCB-MM4]